MNYGGPAFYFATKRFLHNEKENVLCSLINSDGSRTPNTFIPAPPRSGQAGAQPEGAKVWRRLRGATP